MQEIMLAIVLGIAVGLANLLSYKIKFYLSKLSTLCLCTMLFCLGAKSAVMTHCWQNWARSAFRPEPLPLARFVAAYFLSAAIKLLARPADTEEGE